MKSIKTFSDFISETDVVGHDEINATKPTALSEGLCEKLDECMEMARNEAKSWHNDENKEHTGEAWLDECDTYINQHLDNLKEEFTNIAGFNRADGDMRQGSVQDIPALSGGVR